MTFDKDLAMKRLNESIVKWDRLIQHAKGHEKDIVAIRLPEPIKREYTESGTNEVVEVEFPAISFVMLPNGKEISLPVRFDENNHPIFSVSEDILKMFVEEKE